MNPDNLISYLDLTVNFFEPLISSAEDPLKAESLLTELGYLPPANVLAFNEFSSNAAALLGIVETIDDALNNNEDPITLFPKVLDLLIEASRFFNSINNLTARIQTDFAGSDFLAQTDILEALPRKLADFLVVTYLENYRSAFGVALALAGIIDNGYVEESANPFLVPYRKRIVKWDRLFGFIKSPIGTLKNNFIDNDNFLYDHIIFLINRLGVALGLFSSYSTPEGLALEAFHNGANLTIHDIYEDLTSVWLPLINDFNAGPIIEVYPLLDPSNAKYNGIGVGLRFGGQLNFPISDKYQLVLKFHSRLNDSFGFTVDRNGNFKFINKIFTDNAEKIEDTAQFGLKLILEPTEDYLAEKMWELDAPGSIHFEIGSISYAIGMEKLGSQRFFAESNLKDCKISIDLSKSDNFISSLISAKEINVDFGFGIGIATDAGLYFQGSSSLCIKLPIHLTLGTIDIQSLSLVVAVEQDSFPISIAAGLSGKLGPLSIAIEDIGMQITFRIDPNRNGNLGPLDAKLAFKPPKGVGLSIDTGAIKGGGFLYLDYDKGEYTGAIELTVAGWINLKAIGIINTRLPGNPKGFSLLIIITSEFGTGIQLGYGFVLLGIGGLLGLNRTMKLEPLVEGVRTGSINSIMFPNNVVANIQRIISDIQAFFPPMENRFLIGPMAKLGWGTPPLISASLGIIFEIPGNIAILGVLKATLPNESAPLLVLQVNFVGAIEFDKKRIYFFASLFESRVLFITISGEMGLLMAWGEDANFVLSVGGFHPQFNPPPLPFPTPQRVCLNILDSDNARIRVMGYFAVTSNTVQFGARAELYFGFSAINLSGHMAFDALIQFSPFYFIVQISCEVSLKVFGLGLFSISLRFSLEGPTPWRAIGHGSITFLFFTISASFDITWGESHDTSLPPIDVMPILKAEFEKMTNWTAQLPKNNNLLVSLRKLDEKPGEVILHPAGTLRVSQRAVPLDIAIDKVGSQKVNDAKLFRLVSSGDLAKLDDTWEQFALAQYLEMDNADKLSLAAFDPMHGGLLLSIQGEQLNSSHMAKRIVRYEIVIIDSNYMRFVLNYVILPSNMFSQFLNGNSVALSPLSAASKKKAQPFDEKIQIKPELYTVALIKNNKAYQNDAKEFKSQALANEYLRKHTLKNPKLAEQLHVIPDMEVNTNP